MAVPIPSSRWPALSRHEWWSEMQGGVVGSLAVLAVPLSLGLLAWSALGGPATRVALWATFVTSALGGLLYPFISGSRMPVSGPSSATSLILSGLVLRFDADPRLAAGSPADLLWMLGSCSAAVALSGVLQMLMAQAGLARLARLVPRPVLAGFMNGVSLLILWGQLPLLLGLAPGTALDATAWGSREGGALALGAGTVALLVAGGRWRPRWPTALLALALGTVVALAVHASWPAAPLGPTVGVRHLDGPDAWAVLQLADTARWTLLQDHLPALMTTAVVLALIGGLESLLSLLALDEELRDRHDPRRELRAIGLANIACGLIGGLPVVVLRARAMAIYQAGGHTRWAPLAGSVVLLLLFTAGAPLLALLPLPVLGGVMVMIAVGLVDRWSGRLLWQWWRGESSADLRSGLAVMLAVCAVTLWKGFAAGVALGLLLSMVIFISRMNRSQLLRGRYTGAQRPSRRVYPEDLERHLAERRDHVELWELEGALFFGNADRLVQLADSVPAERRVLVLDLVRVGSVDETGATALLSLNHLMQRRNIQVLLAGVVGGGAVQRALAAFRVQLPAWPDADLATEAAEALVLGSMADMTLAPTPPAGSDLLRGLDPAVARQLAARMHERRLSAGEALFRQGDAADGLYVLAQGSISIVGRSGSSSQRFLSMSPGMMVGEAALIDGRGRSADALADMPSVVYHLDQATLLALEREQPQVALQLHRNIARYLSTRLRSASAAWWTVQA